MRDVRRDGADFSDQAARPQHGQARHGPEAVQLGERLEPIRKATEVTQRQDVALEAVVVDEPDHFGDQTLQAAVVELVHDVKHPQAPPLHARPLLPALTRSGPVDRVPRPSGATLAPRAAPMHAPPMRPWRVPRSCRGACRSR